MLAGLLTAPHLARMASCPGFLIPFKAWHQILIGNDWHVRPTGLFLDDVEIWSDYGMTAP